MKELNGLHQEAMNFCDKAFFAKQKGNVSLAKEFSSKALEFEIRAAEILKDKLDTEPTRSILYRSAASIAIDCEEYRKAEQLIASALIGNPPAEIAEELRDLLEQVNFKRHLKLRNVDLSENEIQLSMEGNEVGYGTVLMDAFVGRIKDFERVVYRTVERLSGKGFRDRGSPEKLIQDSYSLYMTAPRAGSFAVTLQLGRQMVLPGLDFSTQVIDEVITCFDLINEGNTEKLKEQIPQEPYYLNFVNLAKRIAPDGEKVSMVGLTKVREHKEIGLALTKKRNEISVTSKLEENKETETKILASVTGRLLFADALRSESRIQLVEENSGVRHTIIVPEGMMDDIVKPLWDEIVVVKGLKVKNRIYLSEIFEAES